MRLIAILFFLLSFYLQAQVKLTKLSGQFRKCVLNKDEYWCISDALIYSFDAKTFDIKKKIDKIANEFEIYHDINCDTFGNVWVNIFGKNIARYNGIEWQIWNSNTSTVIDKDWTFYNIGIENSGVVWLTLVNPLINSDFKFIKFVNNNWINDNYIQIRRGYPPLFYSGYNGEFLIYNSDTIIYKTINSWGSLNYKKIEFTVFDPLFSFSKDSVLYMAYGNQVLKFDKLSSVPIVLEQSKVFGLISAIVLDDSSKIWISGNDYISFFDGNKWNDLPTSNKSIYNSYTNYLFKGPQNAILNLQTISRNGIAQMFTQFNEYKPVKNYYVENHSVNNFISDGNDGLLFGGDSYALSRLDLKTGSYSYFEDFSQYPSFGYNTKFVQSDKGETYLQSSPSKILKFNNLLFYELGLPDSLTIYGINDFTCRGDDELILLTKFPLGEKIYTYNTNSKKSKEIIFQGFENINGVDVDANNVVWISGSRNFVRYINDTIYKVLDYPKGYYSSPNKTDFRFSKNGDVYLLNLDHSKAGFFRFDNNLWDWEFIELEQSMSQRLLGEGVRAIIDYEGRPWLFFIKRNIEQFRFELSIFVFENGNWIEKSQIYVNPFSKSFSLTVDNNNIVYMLTNHELIECNFNPNKTIDVKRLEHNSLNLYPNPVQDFLHLDIKDLKNSVINIYNSSGQNIQSDLSLKNKILDVSNFASGLYYIQVLDGDGKINTSRFVKN